MDNFESTYRINVAIARSESTDFTKGFYHHFAVNVNNEKKAMVLFAELREKYPLPLYDVSVTFWDIKGSIKHWSIDQHNEVIDNDAD